MAYKYKFSTSTVRDNFNRWQKYNTVRIKKAISEKADKLGEDIAGDVADKLEQTLHDNIIASYQPRGDGGYKHTDTLANSVYTEITKTNQGSYKVTAKIRDELYDDGGKGRVSTVEVYDFLRFGTKGSTTHHSLPNGVEYDYFFEDDYSDKPLPAINYPTPPHLFEEHTQEQMNGYIDELVNKYKRR